MLKEKIKSIGILYKPYTFLKKKFVYFKMKYLKSLLFWIEWKSVFGKAKKKKNALKELKGTKSGRCFIVATGPSLTVEDLQKLKNETTFGMNSLIKWFDKTGWETTYYGIQDYNTFTKLKEDINRLKDSTVFFSLSGQAPMLEKKGVNVTGGQAQYEYPLYYGNHLVPNAEWNTRFSEDVSDVVYDGYTIAYSLLQIAIYMGYTEIYLIGTDCNYNVSKKNIIDIGVRNSNTLIQGDRMIFAYQVAKEYADAHGIKIYNATRGGMLEIFERVDLDDIL